MEATDEAGDKGADDAEAGEDGIASEGTEPAPARSQGLGGEAIMGDKKRNEEEKQQPGYHNSAGIAAEERVRLLESRYGVDKEQCRREPNQMAGVAEGLVCFYFSAGAATGPGCGDKRRHDDGIDSKGSRKAVVY